MKKDDFNDYAVIRNDNIGDSWRNIPRERAENLAAIHAANGHSVRVVTMNEYDRLLLAALKEEEKL